MAVALTAISTSGPLIAATAAPALAIALWRCLLGGGLTAVYVGVRGVGRRVSTAERRVLILAGVLLAAHFAAWIPSLRYTSVASSTALVATQPVWAALIARARGVHVPGMAWAGIAVALAGILILTGIDFSLDPRSLLGDLLALVGAVLAAAYVTAGERARRTVSTPVYTTWCYLVAAAALLPMCLIAGVSLFGYSGGDWTRILLLTLGAQLLGHSLINRVLATTSATVVSLGILFEMPLSTLLAALWLGQIPPPAIIPAVLLLFAGLALVIRSAQPLSQPPPD